MGVVDVSERNFDEITSRGIAVIECWAPWCSGCRIVGKMIEEFSKEFPDVKFGKLNTDENEELAQRLGVLSLPTILIYKDGEEINRFIGTVNKDDLRVELLELHEEG